MCYMTANQHLHQTDWLWIIHVDVNINSRGKNTTLFMVGSWSGNCCILFLEPISSSRRLLVSYPIWEGGGREVGEVWPGKEQRMLHFSGGKSTEKQVLCSAFSLWLTRSRKCSRSPLSLLENSLKEVWLALRHFPFLQLRFPVAVKYSHWKPDSF